MNAHVCKHTQYDKSTIYSKRRHCEMIYSENHRQQISKIQSKLQYILRYVFSPTMTLNCTHFMVYSVL